MTLFENDTDPGMRYEGLARAAFDNCIKAGDPWGYAAQETFNNFVPSPILAGKRALSTILIKIIIDSQFHPLSGQLIQLEERVWKANDQTEIIDIIDKAISIFKKTKD